MFFLKPINERQVVVKLFSCFILQASLGRQFLADCTTSSACIFGNLLGRFEPFSAGKLEIILLCPRDLHGYRMQLSRTFSGRLLAVSYEKALDLLSRDDRFRATVYAMNTLLIHKGIYTQEEFQQLFVEWASKQLKNSSQEISHEAASA
jgi:hypothetical protein